MERERLAEWARCAGREGDANQDFLCASEERECARGRVREREAERVKRKLNSKCVVVGGLQRPEGEA